MDSKRFIDLKNSIAIKNLDKINKLKHTYFDYLDLESNRPKENNKDFLEHYNQEILRLGLETEILQLMEQWKKEYNEKIRRNAIDSSLVKEIKQKVYELYNDGYDKKTIIDVIESVFGRRISEPVLRKELFSDIINSYLDSITR